MSIYSPHRERLAAFKERLIEDANSVGKKQTFANSRWGDDFEVFLQKYYIVDVRNKFRNLREKLNGVDENDCSTGHLLFVEELEFLIRTDGGKVVAPGAAFEGISSFTVGHHSFDGESRTWHLLEAGERIEYIFPVEIVASIEAALFKKNSRKKRIVSSPSEKATNSFSVDGEIWTLKLGRKRLVVRDTSYGPFSPTELIFLRGLLILSEKGGRGTFFSAASIFEAAESREARSDNIFRKGDSAEIKKIVHEKNGRYSSQDAEYRLCLAKSKG